jgi:glycosyltransferase involved in cell wall biosynthesis
LYNKHKFSIVTISYNQAEFLERAILSVIEQDLDNVDYIIVDPGSTDGSREIIERYRTRLGKVIFEADKGPADGLNKGFSNATGEIFGFLNSDDILYPGTLKRVSDFFDEHQDVDVVSADAFLIDENENPIRKLQSDNFSLIRYAYGSNLTIQQSTFFKSHIYHKVGGFNPQNKCAWDGELFVDMALAGGRFTVVREIWGGFRSHSKSITSSAKFNDEIKQYRDKIFKKILNRNLKLTDYPLKFGYRVMRHLGNPRGIIERLTKGPVYGRYKSISLIIIFYLINYGILRIS